MRTEYAFTLKSTTELENGISYPYSYPISGWRDQLLSYNGESFVYDTLGNPTTYRNKTLQWSHGRQLDSFGDIATYTYNANGVRTSKTVNGVTTKFYLNGNQIVCQDNGNKMFFHYGMDGISGFTLQLSEIISRDFTYKKNLQGDVIGIYDQNDVLFCKYVYDAWGNHKTYVLVGNDYVELNNEIESTYASIAKLNPFRYRGYYYDNETGLYYLNSRYYEPELGRFINADDISILNNGKDYLSGLNLYSYCFNNPINDTDENGNWSWNKFWNVVKTVAVVVAVVATVAVVTVATAGVGTAIGSAMGGSAAAMIAGGAVGGAITGAVTGAVINGGISIISEGLSNGYENIDWRKVGIDTLIGAGTGAISGAIFGAAGRALGLLGKTNVAQRTIPNLKESKSAFMFGSKSGSFTFVRFGSGNGIYRLESSLAHGFHMHIGLKRAVLKVARTNLLTGIWNSLTAIVTSIFLNK